MFVTVGGVRVDTLKVDSLEIVWHEVVMDRVDPVLEVVVHCPQTPLGAKNKQQRKRRFKRKFLFKDLFSKNPNTVQPRLWEGEFG
jgi:hypothetical protein